MQKFPKIKDESFKQLFLKPYVVNLLSTDQFHMIDGILYIKDDQEPKEFSDNISEKSMAINHIDIYEREYTEFLFPVIRFGNKVLLLFDNILDEHMKNLQKITDHTPSYHNNPPLSSLIPVDAYSIDDAHLFIGLNEEGLKQWINFCEKKELFELLMSVQDEAKYFKKNTTYNLQNLL